MKKPWVFILVFTFISFSIWLIADLSRTPSAFERTKNLDEALAPLNPTFNQEAIQQVIGHQSRLDPFNPKSTATASSRTNSP